MRCSAISGNNKYMSKSFRVISYAVSAVVKSLDYGRFVSPVTAFRSGRHGDIPITIFVRRHHHLERYSFPIGRPQNIGGTFVQTANLACSSLGIHPTNKNLCSTRFPLSHESYASTIGRPSRRRAIHEKPVPRTITVYDPERIVPAVIYRIYPTPAVNDLTAIGRKLSVGYIFPTKVTVNRKAVGQVRSMD